MQLFVAMESDYDGAWIYGVYDTLDGAMAILTEALGPNPRRAMKERYVFVEEWPLNGINRMQTHEYTP